MRTKLDYVEPEPQTTEKDNIIDHRDAEYKQRMKQQREGKTSENNLLLGDYVLVKQPKRNKWSTPYEPVFYAMCSIQGTQIMARRVTDGRTVCRDASQFKLQSWTKLVETHGSVPKIIPLVNLFQTTYQFICASSPPIQC